MAMTVRDALVALTASVATLLIHYVAQHHGAYYTTLGRPKAKGERAFVLSVGLQFRDNTSAQDMLRAWSSAAAYCVQHEPFLFACAQP